MKSVLVAYILWFFLGTARVPARRCASVQHGRAHGLTGAAGAREDGRHTPDAGTCGAHRCYLDSTSMGVLYFFTVGLFLIGWLIDLCLIPGLVDECNHRSQPIVIVAGGGATAGVNNNIVVQHQQAYAPYPQQPGSPYPPQGYPQQGYQQQQQGYPPQGYPPSAYGRPPPY